jgi:hypothetical protein
MADQTTNCIPVADVVAVVMRLLHEDWQPDRLCLAADLLAIAEKNGLSLPAGLTDQILCGRDFEALSILREVMA